MLALVAERRDHQVGGAVHHLRTVDETRRRIHEAAEPHDAHDLVEVAERGLDLGEKIDRAGARRLLAVLDGDAAAELALGDELAAVEANLAGYHEQIAGAHERQRNWRPARPVPQARCRARPTSSPPFRPFSSSKFRSSAARILRRSHYITQASAPLPDRSCDAGASSLSSPPSGDKANGLIGKRHAGSRFRNQAEQEGSWLRVTASHRAALSLPAH